MLLAALLSACVVTEIPELKSVDFECPEKVLQIRVSGDAELIEEYVRVDMDRSEMPKNIPLRTVEAADHAIAAMHWIQSTGVPVEEFMWTVEDRAGKYICAIRVKVGEHNVDEVISGDCAGAGKK